MLATQIPLADLRGVFERRGERRSLTSVAADRLSKSR
jgi:hypothetical protein